jgi:hypothetical protein
MDFREANEIVFNIFVGKQVQLIYPFNCFALVYDLKFRNDQPDPFRNLNKIWKSPRKFSEEDIDGNYISCFFAKNGFYSHSMKWIFIEESIEIKVSTFLSGKFNEIKNYKK